MRLEVIRDSGPGRMDELRGLFDAVRTKTHHEPLGEHKVLDLVHGGPDCFRGIVARDDNDVVGYAHLSRHGDKRWGLEVVATPTGLREELAREALELVTGEGGGHVHFWVFRPTERDDALAHELGLEQGKDLLHMRVALPLGRDLHVPEGFVLRSFVPGKDEDAWLAVNNRAFARHHEQGGWDRKTLERRMSEAWFDPEGFIVAEDDSGIAGFCWTKLGRDCGEIYVIGVDPRAQGSGLGKTLVVAGLEHIAKSQDAGCLYVDSTEQAPVELYKSLGFEIDHVDRAYMGDVA